MVILESFSSIFYLLFQPDDVYEIIHERDSPRRPVTVRECGSACPRSKKHNVRPELSFMLHALNSPTRLRQEDHPETTRPQRGRNLAAGAIVSLRPALPFPPLLLPLPDYVHTPRKTSAISL